MSWLSRIFTLPKARNSLSDLLGPEMSKQLEKGLENAEAFAKSCAAWLADNPDKAQPFVRSLLLLLQENAHILRRNMATSDPFRDARANTRLFCIRWGVQWHG